MTSTEIMTASYTQSAAPTDTDMFAAPLIGILRKNAGTALLANAVLAVAVAAVMRGAVETPVLIAWLAVVLALNGARLLHIMTSRNTAGEFDVGWLWARLFTIGAGLTGAAWGIGAVVMFPTDAIHLQVFLAFVLGGLAAGAVVSSASWLPAYFAFAVPALAPLIIRFLVVPGELPLVMGAMLLLFLGFLGALARSFNASLRQTMSLKGERSRLLDERNLSEAFFSKTFHSSPVLMTLSNPRDGTHYDVNRAWSALTGYSHEQAMRKTSLELGLWTRPEDRQTFIEILNRDGAVSGFETVFRARDGSERDMLVAGEYIREGENEKLLFIGQDITRLKEVERLKSEFVSVVSHELRTPLTSIKGSLGLVLSGGTGEVAEKSRQLLTLAERNTDRLTSLVNDILDFEKLRSGEMQFADLRFDLTHLVGDMVSECAPLAEQFGIEFVWSMPTQKLNVSGDAARIGQVITNILSNAAKFSPAGEQVGISVSSENARARVEVSDRGPGIDESFREAIFERFTQGDSSDTRQNMGTGLGLGICKSIIDHHLGDIDFRANEGGGTTFFFELPLALET
ncbi:MAG: PAS domain-containing sensor histidine kinase [Rhodospirillales bacterium]|jgi:PAS domain S-box-containing protein|nr:hypothetical protein [Rhodospirillaceae bacterium]MDP6427393.1 PAS domain-containing sensor histidine kinase [Rhodospirillales bacterium]MDP6643455.1 PAS domain-containing sensor histidine kinase [Rhodospirillales bacterium]MDP6840789.1 PAS domain-containing sensor histidine kinase [Rhodospirillales bacterium]|tara:strand:- start:1187 stop:2896 length:1710 start_codon:yes stop_codon:yes gene_type:complete